MSPCTDMLCTGNSYVEQVDDDPCLKAPMMKVIAQAYAGSNDLRNPLISPLYGDYTGLPPLLIQVGTRELLLDDSVRVAEKARQAGVDVTLEVEEDMYHAFQYVYNAPEAIAATDRLGAFLKRHSLQAVPAK